MARIRLLLAYDGRPFRGWQSQPGGGTVQDVLEEALREIAGPDCARVPVHGSGRTDSGVHAWGQVAHFDAPEHRDLDPGAWQAALNANLPASIRVREATTADPNFHARFDATGKTYRYRIWCGPVLPPHEAGLAWHQRVEPDNDRLGSALEAIQGRHDFARFAAFRGKENRDDPPDTVRTIRAAGWDRTEVPGGIVLTLSFTGDGFLYKMVRLLTGACLRCAVGRMEVEEIAGILANPRGGDKSPHCAPPDGLTLVEVDYGEAPPAG